MWYESYLKSFSKPCTFSELITTAMLHYVQNEFVHCYTKYSHQVCLHLYHTGAHTHTHTQLFPTSSSSGTRWNRGKSLKCWTIQSWSSCTSVIVYTNPWNTRTENTKPTCIQKRFNRRLNRKWTWWNFSRLINFFCLRKNTSLSCPDLVMNKALRKCSVNENSIKGGCNEWRLHQERMQWMKTAPRKSAMNEERVQWTKTASRKDAVMKKASIKGCSEWRQHQWKDVVTEISFNERVQWWREHQERV